jgi:hypothetical protein
MPKAVWLPDLLGSKAHLVDELLAAFKRIQAEKPGVYDNQKAMAGGVFYGLVEAMAGKPVAQKLWSLLNNQAGLGFGYEIWSLVHRSTSHLDDGPKGQLQAAAIGISLLQRTKQPSKAERANKIMLAEPLIAEALTQAGPVSERSKPKSATAEFTEMVKAQESYAREISTKLKKNPQVAAALVWLTLEDVNAHSESSEAESILSVLKPTEEEQQIAQRLAGTVGQHIDYGVVEAGAFGVALMMAVGQAKLARPLAKAMIAAFKQYLGPGNLLD